MIGSGFEWMFNNLGLSVLIYAGIVIGIAVLGLAIIGLAFSAKLLAIKLAVALPIAFAAFCIAGIIGGPGGDTQVSTNGIERNIDRLLISHDSRGSLTVEVFYRGKDSGERQTWNQSNLSERVEQIFSRIPPSDSGVNIHWKGTVPGQLRQIVIEEFRLRRLQVNESIAQ